MKHIAVAIDGPGGAGKSTLARAAAKRFGLLYVDTGAIYRTVGLAAFRSGTDPDDPERVSAMLPELEIGMAYDAEGVQQMLLNGENVSAAIRTPEISAYASRVSALQLVRDYLMDTQRDLAAKNSVIMDGRDIGTVVLPDAELKVFLTASAEARARRRYAELVQKGIETDLEEVLRDINERDERDSSRAAAPLRRAEDAVLLDTTELTLEESLERLCEMIQAKL